MLHKSKYLSEAEQKQLLNFWNSMKKAGGKRNICRWLLVNVAIGSGLRASELTDIKPEHFLFGEFPSLRVNTRKGGDGNTVYISNRLAKDLRWYLRNHNNGNQYLFTSETGRKQTNAGLWNLWQTALKKAGLPHFPLHASRHSFACNIYRKSKDIVMTQKQLRHKSISSTQIYADVSVEQISETMNNL